jgi:hypothetical protein
MFSLNPMTYLLAGVAGLALLTASFGAGFEEGKVHESKVATLTAEKAAQGERALGDAKVKAILVQDQLDAVARAALADRDAQRVSDLTDKISMLSAANISYRKVLNEKPDPDPTCHLRVGDVRMLNDAASGSSPGGSGAKGLPDPARVSAYQEQTPADLTLRGFVGAELDIRTQYNQLKAQNDKLIDWVHDEIIVPMQNIAGPTK